MNELAFAHLLRVVRNRHVKVVDPDTKRCSTCGRIIQPRQVGTTWRWKHVDLGAGERGACPPPPGLMHRGETWANLKGKQEVEIDAVR